jgi:hypothetical protein
VEEIWKILIADLNSSQENGFWNCYNNAGISVLLQEGTALKETTAGHNNI